MDIPSALTYVIKDQNIVDMINNIRLAHDPAFKKWSHPHINLFYPFIKHDLGNLIGILPELDQFNVCFDKISYFKLGMTYYIYLGCDKESEQKISELRHKIIALYPDIADKYPYEPYLILGQCYKPDLDDCLIKFNKDLADIIDKKNISGDTYVYVSYV